MTGFHFLFHSSLIGNGEGEEMEDDFVAEEEAPANGMELRLADFIAEEDDEVSFSELGTSPNNLVAEEELWTSEARKYLKEFLEVSRGGNGRPAEE
jgi:translation elongation factor P/translation initiation factor 5A